MTRHLHKVGAGWTVHEGGVRVAWFRNIFDLERWLRASYAAVMFEPLIDALGELDR